MEFNFEKSAILKKWKENSSLYEWEIDRRIKELEKEETMSRIQNTKNATEKLCKFMGIEPDPETGQYPLIVHIANDPVISAELAYLRYLQIGALERMHERYVTRFYDEWEMYSGTEEQEALAQAE